VVLGLAGFGLARWIDDWFGVRGARDGDVGMAKEKYFLHDYLPTVVLAARGKYIGTKLA
jgi:hypothetical protein